jgi:predicted kinase
VAAFINEYTGFSVWNSDVVRKELAGLSPTARGSGDYQAGIYTEAMTQQTYAALAHYAEEELSTGRGVILDASCRQPAHRRLFRSVAEGCEVPVFFLECQADAHVIESRLRARAKKEAVVSDATWETALQHQADFPRFDDLPDACHIVINTEQTQEALRTTIEQTCERLI